MLPALAMTGLSAGLSFLSGIGAKQATAKQGRLQRMEDARVFQANTQRQEELNAARAALGERLLKRRNAPSPLTIAGRTRRNGATWTLPASWPPEKRPGLIP